MTTSMNILFENKEFLVINKPAGVVVNRAQTQSEATIQDYLVEYLGEKVFSEKEIAQTKVSWQKLVPRDFSDEFGTPEEIWQERQGLVHRLDKETSGVLLLAKNPGALVNLLAQFKQRQTKKTYLALCHGRFTLKNGKINAPLGRASRNRLRFAIDPAGKAAETFYRVLASYQNFDWQKLKQQLGKGKTEAELRILRKTLKRGPQLYQAGFSLVEAQPKTGRTHQLRVHFASLQHPLVGDKVYSGKKRQVIDKFWCSRHFLHAAKIEFFLPDGKEWENKQGVEAKLTNDLQAAVTLLK